MTEDEIRKLLGGYATDALTADERRILFEAALDDQDLFNALQDEDALKELLADPVSREQARETLAGSIANKPRPRYWPRRWIYGVAVPAIAAVIAIAVLYRPNTSERISPPVQGPVESPPAEPTRVAAQPKAAPPAAKKRSTASRAPAPAIAAPEVESARRADAPAATDFLAAAPSRMPDAVRQQFRAGFAADAPLYQGPLVRYSLVRGGGDALRLEVSTGVAGYLAMYRLDAAGNSTRVYPVNDVAVRLLPDRTIQIPASPIKIGGGERLRLVVVPVAPSAVNGAIGGALGASPIEGQPTPLVVDIPLVPN